MLGISKNREQGETALKVIDTRPPSTYFNIKDHKSVPEGAKCPDTRKVCSATDGLLSRLEYLSSIWFDRVVEAVPKV